MDKARCRFVAGRVPKRMRSGSGPTGRGGRSAYSGELLAVSSSRMRTTLAIVARGNGRLAGKRSVPRPATAVLLGWSVVDGEPGGIRTHDTGIKSPLLCH